MSLNALFITQCFPPYSFAESFLAAKRMGNIPGVKVDVVTMDAFFPWVEVDNSLEHYISKKFGDVKRIAPPKWYSKIPFHRCKNLFSIPDSYRWLNFMYRKALKNKIWSDYDVMITSSMYHSAHLIGLQTKKLWPHLPWIANFSDPWSQNPYSIHNFLVKKINLRYEQAVLQEADIVVFSAMDTAIETLKHYKNLDPNKIKVVSHCFDDALYERKSEKEKKNFVVRYLGNFYANRTPDVFLEALKIALETNADCLKGLKVEFIGPTEQGRPISCPRLSKIVRFLPRVSYTESLSLMMESDLLLLIDSPAKHNIFLPSKLIDYLGAGRPIFGITPPGEACEIIREYGGTTVSTDQSPREMAKCFIEAIEAYQGRPLVINHLIRERYTVKTIGAEYQKIIQRLL